jgi:hypothetical protein
MEGSPLREVVQGEALAWLDDHPAEPGSSVITSLPDVSELPELGFDGWRGWFIAAAERVMRWLPDDGVAIFYQSDIRWQSVWIDKAHLVHCAADNCGRVLLFHKIVCRSAPGTISWGRASYSHLVCVANAALEGARKPGPDVLPDAGAMPWSRAMGVEACRLACSFLRDNTSTRRVVDPFCGKGTALAVANTYGFDAIGVERSGRRCRAARKLTVE